MDSKPIKIDAATAAKYDRSGVAEEFDQALRKVVSVPASSLPKIEPKPGHGRPKKTRT
jgi:hypothetical protein